MNPFSCRPRLRIAWTGIAALFSLFPTLLYLWVVSVPGLEVVARKPEIFSQGLYLFGSLQLLAFCAAGAAIVLIWRPGKKRGLRIVRRNSDRNGKKEDSCPAC